MSQSVTKKDFINACLQRGMGYAHANAAYDAMLVTFEHAIVQGRKIRLGGVGTITPKMSGEKKVKMGFKRVKGKVIKCKREFILGRRLYYKLNLHKSFMQRHQFDWFSAGE